jgi:hypothetical protein
VIPRVSVVLPVRDAERYVRDAVESVLAQSLGEFELIAVDDGSTDGSLDVLRSFDDPRVRVLERGAAGLTATLRAGCAAATGEYIARMDADDVALPGRLAAQVRALDADPGLAVCGGAVVMLDEHGARGSIVRFPEADGAIRRALPHYNCFAHPAVTMRRSAYEAVGGYRLVNGEDYDLWLRLAEGFRLANLADPVLLYRHHPAQYSVERLDDQAVGVLAAQYAARLRAQGREDPLGDAGALTADVLAALRLAPEVVREAQAAHHLRWAALLEQLGSRAAAEQLFAEAERRAPGQFAVRRSLARAQAALAARRPVGALTALAAGAAAHPVAFPRELVRAIRSRRSFEPSR